MKIVNICGFPRSGTTFLASLLHSQIGFFALPECQFRFAESVFTSDNIFDQIRHLKRVKKSYLSWNELADCTLSEQCSHKHRFKPLQTHEQFLNYSIAFCNRYYSDFSAEFLVDHTPENLFGFDNTSDYDNQYFIFIRRSLTDIVKSHRNVKWSNQPISLLTSRYCIYSSYVDYLCNQLNSLGLGHHYLSLTYNDLLIKSISQIVYESGSKSFLFDALVSGQKPHKSSNDFPLPRYTRNQHSNIGYNISESKLISESKDTSLFFHQMRSAYHSLTFPEILRGFIFRK